jgi:hypothetical protein
VSLCAPGSLTDPEISQPEPGDPDGISGAPNPAEPKLGDFFFMGTACAISVVGAGAAGYGLDSWLGTTPWLTFAGLAFGIVCAVLICVKEVRKYS